MRKRKKIDSSTIVLSTIIVFFTIIIFLSLPVLFNYKSLQNEIEKKFLSEFKISLKILGDISYRVLPKPHLLINKANLDINLEDEKSSIIEIDNLKIFVPTNKIYAKSNVVLNSFEFTNANINFKMNDIIDFRNHLYFKINKKINLKNFKLFLLDQDKNNILISPIEELEYLINNKNNSKELKIKGSIFDIKFNSIWRRYYEDPKNTTNEIKLKNPNINIKNLFSFESNENFKGSTSINFLNEEIDLDYIYFKKRIRLQSPEKNNNQKILLNSSIELDPFYFNSNITLKDKTAKFIIDYVLNYLLSFDKEKIKNLDGKLALEIKDLKNPILNEGIINFLINEGDIKIIKSEFNIEDAGKIQSDFSFYEKMGDIIFSSKNILYINDKKEFSRKFQLNSKKIENIEKIYFDLEKNIDTGEIFISNIYLNDPNSKNFSEAFIKIPTIQVLKAYMRDIFG